MKIVLFLIRSLVFCLFSFLILTACASGSNENACPYGKPAPIFSDTLEAVRAHIFETNEQEASEQVLFVTGQELEILQSGCETLRQEFQFSMEGDYTSETPAFWLQQATLYFQFLGKLSNQHYALYAWGQAIAEVAPEMKLGEAYEVQPHFEVTVDKIVSKEQAMLIVTLSQTALE